MSGSRRQPGQDPLLVFGPRSLTYDFGPGHPLTTRRFAPSLDLLSLIGARPGLAPEPATDEELLAVHDEAYLRAVQRLSADPSGRPEAGVGPGDTPAFAGMHEASAAVAGGSLRAMDAILAGEVAHAFHPGGGLHHAMPGRASGFCVYNDPALAIRRARDAGLRVLYLDFDVHHGDGVEAIHRADPGVLTFSIHESGESLFPGTGFIGDDGPGAAAGTVVNVPLAAGTGADPWLRAVERLVPELAAAFGPDVIVSQHGCDGHAWDPLANLRLTTTVMGAAARLADRLAHRHAAGRWLSTGGGGYDVYRVVPRAWSLVWLAAAHEPVLGPLPDEWRDRWLADAVRHGQAPLPEAFEDEPEVGRAAAWAGDTDRRASEAVELVRTLAVPALIRAAVDSGWWQPADEDASGEDHPGATDAPSAGSSPAIVPALDHERWAALGLAAQVAGPLDPRAGHRLVGAALRADPEGVIVNAAVADRQVVGVAVSAWDRGEQVQRLLAVGIAPAWRGRGLATAVLRSHVEELDRRARGRPLETIVTTAERDPVAPLTREARAKAARALLEATGFRVQPVTAALGRADRFALQGRRPG